MLTGLLLALTLTVPLGCADDVDDDDGGEDDVGDSGKDRPDEVCKSSCEACEDLMKEAYACMAFDEFEEPLPEFSCIVCDNDGWGSAALSCGTQATLQSVLYATMEAQPVACEGLVAENCVGWAPARQVRQTGANEWDVERDFIAALVADPSQLVSCDHARVKASSGSYRAVSVDSDDLLGELGLISDDVIESVNGYALNGPFDVALAFFNLWPDTRVFTISVRRSGVGTIALTYNLI